MWTYKDKVELDNITIREHYRDNKHVQTQLIAHDGYVLKLKDDNGYVDDNNINHPPAYSKTVIGGTWLDINSYEAILESEIESEEVT